MTSIAAAYSFDFIRVALPAHARKVLEVGCGSGEVARLLQEAGLEVVALDSDEEAVASARASGVDARRAAWPDFSGAGFDAVIFTRSLHHMPSLDRCVGAAFAILSPGGLVIVEDFAFDEMDKKSRAWFASVAGMLAASGHPVPAHSYVAELLGVEEHAHDEGRQHHIHGATALAAALDAHAERVSASGSAYFFRYLEPMLGASSDLLGGILTHELDLIELGLIKPLGRRFVAECPTAAG